MRAQWTRGGFLLTGIGSARAGLYYPARPVSGGRIIGTLFFGLLDGTVLTSIFRLLEVPSAYLARRLSCSRRQATVLAAGLSFIAGIPPPALGFGVLEQVRCRWHFNRTMTGWAGVKLEH